VSRRTFCLTLVIAPTTIATCAFGWSSVTRLHRDADSNGTDCPCERPRMVTCRKTLAGLRLTDRDDVTYLT